MASAGSVEAAIAMSEHRSLEQAEETFGGEFYDQAFEPRSSFDFEDELSNLQNNMNAFGGEHMGFHFSDGMHDEMMDQNLFDSQTASYPMGNNTLDADMSLVDPANVWQGMHPAQMPLSTTGRRGVQPIPPSVQTEIVSSRPGHVRQQFGQITPPDDNTPENPDVKRLKVAQDPQKTQEEDIAKLHRTQRARNAANKRHAKSKKARKDTGQEDGSDDAEDEDSKGKNMSLQREKNRIAAAKCRAKKKATSEEMQESHREGARENSFLLREMRELRDQKAFLRNSLLQHDPSTCKCHAIHQFNMREAQKLAFGVGAMSTQPMSPSQGSVSSPHTPSSDGSAARTFSVSGPSATTGMADISSRQRSFGISLGEEFSQGTMSNGVSGELDGFADPSQMPQQFSEYLQNSPGRRAAFS